MCSTFHSIDFWSCASWTNGAGPPWARRKRLVASNNAAVRPGRRRHEGGEGGAHGRPKSDACRDRAGSGVAARLTLGTPNTPERECPLNVPACCPVVGSTLV